MALTVLAVPVVATTGHGASAASVDGTVAQFGLAGDDGSQSDTPRSRSGSDDSASRCGVAENLTVAGATLSLSVEDGTARGLGIQGETSNATIANGTVLLDRARISIDRATIYEDRIAPASESITVENGSFFLQNATVADGEGNGDGVSISNRRLRTQQVAASDDGVTISGVERVQGSPVRLLENSSMDALTLSAFEGEFNASNASRDVLGVVQLSMEDVRLTASRMRPTFENVTVQAGTLNATGAAVLVEDGELTIGELAVSTGQLTSRSENVQSDLENRTVAFSDVELASRELSALLERSC